eukprot:3178529-Pyramimonas_sp.AAC.1
MRSLHSPGLEAFELVVGTADVTSWGSANSWPLRTSAHAVCLQEYRLIHGGAGASGGVTIIARSFSGMRDLVQGPLAHPGRAVARWVVRAGSPERLRGPLD